MKEIIELLLKCMAVIELFSTTRSILQDSQSSQMLDFFQEDLDRLNWLFIDLRLDSDTKQTEIERFKRTLGNDVEELVKIVNFLKTDGTRRLIISLN